MAIPTLDLAEASLRARLARRPRLLLLDIDGTLAPFAPRPELVVLPPGTRAALVVLAQAPETHLAIVTGRSAEDGRRIVDVDGVHVIGNHGMERLDPDGGRWTDGRVAPHLAGVDAAAELLAPLPAHVPGVLLEHKRLTLSVHYRLAEPARMGEVEEAARQAAEAHGLRLTRGKLVLELRPPVAVHKGTAALAFAEAIGIPRRGATVVFLGDDRTDEDAFALLRREFEGAVTARVGMVPVGETTAAEFGLPTPAAVEQLLRELALV